METPEYPWRILNEVFPKPQASSSANGGSTRESIRQAHYEFSIYDLLTMIVRKDALLESFSVQPNKDEDSCELVVQFDLSDMLQIVGVETQHTPSPDIASLISLFSQEDILSTAVCGFVNFLLSDEGTPSGFVDGCFESNLSEFLVQRLDAQDLFPGLRYTHKKLLSFFSEQRIVWLKFTGSSSDSSAIFAALSRRNDMLSMNCCDHFAIGILLHGSFEHESRVPETMAADTHSLFDFSSYLWLRNYSGTVPSLAFTTGSSHPLIGLRMTNTSLTLDMLLSLHSIILGHPGFNGADCAPALSLQELLLDGSKVSSEPCTQRAFSIVHMPENTPANIPTRRLCEALLLSVVDCVCANSVTDASSEHLILSLPTPTSPELLADLLALLRTYSPAHVSVSPLQIDNPPALASSEDDTDLHAYVAFYENLRLLKVIVSDIYRSGMHICNPSTLSRLARVQSPLKCEQGSIQAQNTPNMYLPLRNEILTSGACTDLLTRFALNATSLRAMLGTTVFSEAYPFVLPNLCEDPSFRIAPDCINLHSRDFFVLTVDSTKLPADMSFLLTQLALFVQPCEIDFRRNVLLICRLSTPVYTRTVFNKDLYHFQRLRIKSLSSAILGGVKWTYGVFGNTSDPAAVLGHIPIDILGIPHQNSLVVTTCFSVKDFVVLLYLLARCYTLSFSHIDLSSCILDDLTDKALLHHALSALLSAPTVKIVLFHRSIATMNFLFRDLTASCFVIADDGERTPITFSEAKRLRRFKT